MQNLIGQVKIKYSQNTAEFNKNDSYYMVTIHNRSNFLFRIIRHVLKPPKQRLENFREVLLCDVYIRIFVENTEDILAAIAK